MLSAVPVLREEPGSPALCQPRKQEQDHLKGPMSSIVSRKYLVIAATVSGLGGCSLVLTTSLSAERFLTSLSYSPRCTALAGGGCALVGCIFGAMSAGAFVDYLGQKKGWRMRGLFCAVFGRIWFAANSISSLCGASSGASVSAPLRS